MLKNRWCIFGVRLDDFGMVVAENGDCLSIRYSDGQMYPAEFWDKKYVSRFSTPEEAIAHYVIQTGEMTGKAAKKFLEAFDTVDSVNEKAVEKVIKRLERERKKDEQRKERAGGGSPRGRGR